MSHKEKDTTRVDVLPIQKFSGLQWVQREGATEGDDNGKETGGIEAEGNAEVCMLMTRFFVFVCLFGFLFLIRCAHILAL